MIELTSFEIDALGQQVTGFIQRYLETLADQPLLPHSPEPGELSRLFDEPLPLEPQALEAVFAEFEQNIVRNSMRIGHPRFLGWIRTSPLAGAVYAEALAAALNQSVAVWEGAPAATAVELRVIEWLKEMTGFAPSAGGLLLSGGSMANFVCLLAARSAVDPDVREEGLSGRPPFTLYLTKETHYCIPKAAEMMGIGRKYLRTVPLDGRQGMDARALADLIRADQSQGLRPLAVAATLGTVNTGGYDDLQAIGRVCRQLNVWLHVDGAYGGLANLIPEKRLMAAGLSEADSLVIDPHKSLYVPFEAGCALVRQAQHLHNAFAVQADYLPNSEAASGAAFAASTGLSEPFHFRDWGPQLSRSFRALKVYLTLKMYGVNRIAAAISHQYQLAQQLGDAIQASQEFELLAPVHLGIVAFRYRPAARSEVKLDELNARLAAEIQRRGQVFLSTTCVDNHYALRVCFVSFRSTPADVNSILTELHQVALQL